MNPRLVNQCYEYLHRCVNATIERDRLAWMRTEASRSIGGDHGPAAGAVKGGGKGGQKSGKTGDKGKGKVKGDKKGSKGSARRDTSTDSRSDKKEVCKKHLIGKCTLPDDQCPRRHNKPCLFFRAKGGCKNGKDWQYPHVQTTRPAASAQEAASGDESDSADGKKKKKKGRGRSRSRTRAQTPPKGAAGAVVPSALVAQCRGLRFHVKPTTIIFKVEKDNFLEPSLPIVRKTGYRHNQGYPI